MVSFNTALNYSLLPPTRNWVLKFTAIYLPPRVFLVPRLKKSPPSLCVNPGCSCFGTWVLKKRHYYDEGESGFRSTVCRAWECEGDLALESEILEFMNESEKPGAFPTKQELLDAGRADLVKAIKMNGGWLSLGWDSDDENEDQSPGTTELTEKELSKTEQEDGSRVGAKQSQERVIHGSSTGELSSHLASSQIEDETESGIEDILSGLEKQRNLLLGIALEKDLYPALELSKQQRDGAEDLDSEYLGKSNNAALGSQGRSISDVNGSESSLKPEMSRDWSLQPAGFSTEEIEAAEISCKDKKVHEGRDSQSNDHFEITQSSSELLGKQKDISNLDISHRLQHLELELASALQLLRYKNEKYAADEAHGTSDELLNLSDAWEFQENDIIHAKERLRSLRAKLAVLEGKTSLAIIDARKAVKDKQMKVDSARRALELLRTTCIVWPTSASEVLLTGSFDGWTTKRKMEKSSSGIFSLCLKLYPGRYEIKFIVDGMWRVDPLRPVVNNEGHENNLFIVT